MLVTFIGAPCSGKTTTAARLFADLKEQGLPAEFLAEYARFYIALRRRLEKETFPGLDNWDQLAILEAQARNEAVFAADTDSLVIADSSAVSALLYMTDEFLREEEKRVPPYNKPNAITAAREAAARYDIIFRCSPVRPGVLYDPNRIHSYEQSVELDQRISKVFDIAKVDSSKVYPLFGDTKFRVTEASSIVTRKLLDAAKARVQA